MKPGYISVILPAGGEGTRLGYSEPKAFIPVAGKTILEHTIDCFYPFEQVGRIIIPVPARKLNDAREIASKYPDKDVRVIAGGEERLYSINLALSQIEDCTYVAVHDAVRPMVSPEEIQDVFDAALTFGAAMLVTPSDYTLKQLSADMIVQGTADRSRIWQAQTPQVFSTELIRNAYKKALDDQFFGTDDASLVERTGHRVKAVEGSRGNIKITRKQDLDYVHYKMTELQQSVRIGYGYDTHRLADGRALILGGVTIPFEKGLDGHSDADVLIHAVIDALLGALALGDIGSHFPDTDAAFKDIDSRLLLRKAAAIIDEKGYSTGNIDATVVAERPRLRSFIDEMRSVIAGDLGIDSAQVSVKATTSEKIGFVGREEGISASCAALLFKKDR